MMNFKKYIKIIYFVQIYSKNKKTSQKTIQNVSNLENQEEI